MQLFLFTKMLFFRVLHYFIIYSIIYNRIQTKVRSVSMKDFLKDENLTPEELEEKQSSKEVSFEENDNWEFEAEAQTLNSNVLDNGEYEIVIPEKETKVDEPLPKPVAKPKATVQKAPAKKKGIKRDKIVFAITGVITALVIAACVAMGVVYYTLPSSTIDENHLKPADVAMKVGDEKVSLGMYSYYYSVIVNNYVSQAGYSNNLDTSVPYDQQTTTDSSGKNITWQALFDKETKDKVKYVYAYYQAGLDSGVQLTADQQSSITESLKSLESYAKENSQTVDSFITANYGEYCTLDTLRLMLEQCYIAENYYQQHSVENRVTVEDELAYFNEKSKDNYDDYQSVDAALLQVSYTPGDEESQKDAISKANKYAKQIKSVNDMKKLIPTVYKDDIEQYVAQGYATNVDECAELIASSMQQSYCPLQLNDSQRLDSSIEEWLMSAETAKNSVKCFDMPNDGVVYILLKASEAKLDETAVYSVRHILITPTSDDENATSFTKQEWADAEAKAKDVLEEYNKGDKTEYAFAQLAEKYSGDTSSTSAGGQGLFGGAIFGAKKDEMVKSFEEWSLDEARKYGDVDIVKSNYGYHIMFFVETDKAYLQYCEAIVEQEKENDFLDSFKEKSYPKHIDMVKQSLANDQKVDASQAGANDVTEE